jgi:hypothetical protein
MGTAGLGYVRRGWHVFPCRVDEKEPATPRGFKDAKCSEATVRAVWGKNPDLNVAVRTGEASGLVALDVDGDHGADSLRALERKYGDLPKTYSVTTQSGGTHYYFQHPGGTLRNTAGTLAPGLDTRGDGGYVLAAGSVVNGRPYVVDEDVEVAPMPGWLLDLLRALSDPKQSPASTGDSSRGHQDQDQDQYPHKGRGEASERAKDDPAPNQLDRLLAAHAAGEFHPEAVDGLGPMPDRPTRHERALHELLGLLFGLRLANGTCEPLPLATSVVQRMLGLFDKSGASKLLRRFEDLGIIWSPGALPALGKGNGTRTFLPGPKPDGPEPVGGWCVRPAVASGDVPRPALERGPVAVEAHRSPDVAADPLVEAEDEAGVGDAVRGGPAGPLDGVAAAGGGTVGRAAHGSEAYGAPPTSRPTADVLIERAVRRGAPGARNATGFWLACQLRDHGYGEREARRVLSAFRDVAGEGDHPYSAAEARRSVRSAYSTPARPPWGGTAPVMTHPVPHEPDGRTSGDVAS